MRTDAGFDLFVGIDYSGASAPISRVPGLQIYVAEGDGLPVRVAPSATQGHYLNWTRREVAQYLMEVLAGDKRVLVGIDHNLSFPQSYFARYNLSTWDEFLADFCVHWPMSQDGILIKDIIKASPDRVGEASEFRLTERWTSSAKSVFQFGVPGAVAASAHAGIPWVAEIRQRHRERVHFWPFDGFDLPDGASAVVEAYPAIFKRRYPLEGRSLSGHEQDAYAVARWLSETSRGGRLEHYLHPPLTDRETEMVSLEGWILGIC